MTIKTRKWHSFIVLTAISLWALSIEGCGESDGEASPVNSQTTVPNANYKMNVTFYAYDEDGNATENVVSSGTFAFDKASFELDEFEAQWRLRVPRSVKKGPLAESGCIRLLTGPGVLAATRFDGYWSLNLQPYVADNSIAIFVRSISEESWSGEWLHATSGGGQSMGTFEAVKAGG